MYGNSVAIGAPGIDSYNDPNRGSAYVFTRQKPNDLDSSWNYAAHTALSPYNSFEDMNFGRSVSIDRDTMVIGGFAGFGQGDSRPEHADVNLGWRYAEIWTRTSGCLRCTWNRRQELDLPGVVGDS